MDNNLQNEEEIISSYLYVSKYQVIRELQQKSCVLCMVQQKPQFLCVYSNACNAKSECEYKNTCSRTATIIQIFGSYFQSKQKQIENFKGIVNFYGEQVPLSTMVPENCYYYIQYSGSHDSSDRACKHISISSETSYTTYNHLEKILLTSVNKETENISLTVQSLNGNFIGMVIDQQNVQTFVKNNFKNESLFELLQLQFNLIQNAKEPVRLHFKNNTFEVFLQGCRKANQTVQDVLQLMSKVYVCIYMDFQQMNIEYAKSKLMMIHKQIQKQNETKKMQQIGTEMDKILQYYKVYNPQSFQVIVNHQCKVYKTNSIIVDYDPQNNTQLMKALGFINVQLIVDVLHGLANSLEIEKYLKEKQFGLTHIVLEILGKKQVVTAVITGLVYDESLKQNIQVNKVNNSKQQNTQNNINTQEETSSQQQQSSLTDDIQSGFLDE
ncbi:Hypothetical_protein [Hexamita inflata]|uniref:Hypothetical_protein n=1 Tax=Hexamita inflata TaxID=28002 RepID=A0AA86PSL7_9EUKA|nr:Hypothetical protein HINF_LOCUS31783 [Hexamita inflata]